MPTPSWDFPPSNGGLHYDLSDAASAHFQTDRISHVVREVLQNSLDAHDSGFPAVEVLIEERKIPKTEFGGADLLDHLQACLDESEQSVFSNSELEAELLKRAISTLRLKNIRCLAIIDSGTHGLRPDNWRALVGRMRPAPIFRLTASAMWYVKYCRIHWMHTTQDSPPSKC